MSSGRRRQRSSSRSTSDERRGRVRRVAVPPTTRRSLLWPWRYDCVANTAEPSITTKPATPSGMVLLSDAIDQQCESAQNKDRSNDYPTPRVEARIGGAHRRGELRVLGKRPLDLLEQPLLVFRERHGTPPRSSRADPDGSADRRQPSRLLSRKSTSGSAGRKADGGPSRTVFPRSIGLCSPNVASVTLHLSSCRPSAGGGSRVPRRLAGRTTPVPNRAAAASAARSASRQPLSRSPSVSCRGAPPAAASPSTPDPDQADPLAGREAPRTAPTPSRRSPGPRRWRTDRVRDRLSVRKSAKRTLMATVRPAWPARRSRPAAFSASASSVRRIDVGVGDVDVERRLGADRLLRPGRTPRGRGSRPQASSCRCTAAASPSAERSRPNGASARSPTVRRPSRRSVSATSLADAPQRVDRQRVQILQHAAGRAPRPARPAWPGSTRAWR